MKIVISDFVAGARAARGIAVIIDVFRAFSFAAHAFEAGAGAVMPVADIEQARALKRARPERLLFGERHAQPPPDFDGGNSPAQLAGWNLQDRELIHTTHAGTQGLMNALHADQVITGALVNAAAIVRYLQQQEPRQVTLVRMGYEARERCMEDDLCADLLAARLRGEADPVTDVREYLRQSAAAKKFFDPACQHYAPQADFAMCTVVDRFDFVLRLDAVKSPPRLQRLMI